MAPISRESHRVRHSLRTALILLAGAGLAILVTAQDTAASERGLPIRIQSDTAALDDQTGVSVYRGNVVVTQGELVIRSDTLTVHSPGRVLGRMEAEGGPATLRTLTEDGREIHAEARHMEYLAGERHVVLTGQARIWQGEDEFKGEHIVYDLNRETLDAKAGENGRVEVILTPRDDGSGTP